MLAQGQDRRGAHYSLVGIVEHAGQHLASGHYTAYVQRGLQSPSLAASMPSQGTMATLDSTAIQAVHGGGPAVQAASKGLAPSSALTDSWDDITADVLSSPTKAQPPVPAVGLQGELPADAADVDSFQARPEGTETEENAGAMAANGSGHSLDSNALEARAVHINAVGADGSRTGAKSSSNAPPTPQWYHVSDVHVSKVATERVLACDAYILLYMRTA